MKTFLEVSQNFLGTFKTFSQDIKKNFLKTSWDFKKHLGLC